MNGLGLDPVGLIGHGQHTLGRFHARELTRESSQGKRERCARRAGGNRVNCASASEGVPNARGARPWRKVQKISKRCCSSRILTTTLSFLKELSKRRTLARSWFG